MAPQPKSGRRTNSAIAVKETAASSRPRRVVKELVKDVDETPVKRVAKRATASKTAKGAQTTTAAKGATTKGKVGRPPKRKAGKVALDEPAPANTGRKRTKTTKSEANGKKEEPAKVVINETEEAEEAEEDEDGDARDDKSYWLMKAEPESRLEKGVDVKFSIDDLREATEPEAWDARNHMRTMKKGDLAFFYHSNCKVPGIAGVMEIVKEHSVDESAFDPAHPYYDEKSNRDNPKWEVVHVEFRRKFKSLVKLTELKSFAKPGGALENLQMMRQSRLSVSSVTPKQWRFIMNLAEEDEEDEEDEEENDRNEGSVKKDEDNHGESKVENSHGENKESNS
ncbi:conserved hypothetical protein [Uncinocarpus reesii 1704]|uniref:Thymocyte nuclear protein 1 n=1 Tax=Uncinocarpus reesii (strain UAMH 1704) TaxID=336963 RepID=C4JHU9_UNCRE|nr:uncharacterized protein UREG_02785 [Uncinocarpus reesii 1704]EEP77936.1 conserved hypothetical protein [Uncinocarpus reesii 1704]